MCMFISRYKCFNSLHLVHIVALHQEESLLSVDKMQEKKKNHISTTEALSSTPDD